MIRKAFIMELFPEYQDEYRRRHDAIWPEMVRVLKEHGVSNYSIFLDKATSRLFAYAEVTDEEQWNAIAETDVCQKWWQYMKDIMATNPDNSPKSIPLEEVFHLD